MKKQDVSNGEWMQEVGGINSSPYPDVPLSANVRRMRTTEIRDELIDINAKRQKMMSTGK